MDSLDRIWESWRSLIIKNPRVDAYWFYSSISIFSVMAGLFVGSMGFLSVPFFLSFLNLLFYIYILQKYSLIKAGNKLKKLSTIRTRDPEKRRISTIEAVKNSKRHISVEYLIGHHERKELINSINFIFGNLPKYINFASPVQVTAIKSDLQEMSRCMYEYDYEGMRNRVRKLFNHMKEIQGNFDILLELRSKHYLMWYNWVLFIIAIFTLLFSMADIFS